MSYKDLQEHAKELGMKKVVGVSVEKLEKFIKKAKAKSPKKESPKKSQGKKGSVGDQGNTGDRDAVVYHGKHKVRTYTLEHHGKDYIKLAKQYCSHPEREGYRIEFETVETRLTCPHCGKKFRYD